MDIAKYFHQSTKEKYNTGMEKPASSDAWPEEWKTIYFKEYPRMPKIILPESIKLEAKLGETILERKSQREFNGNPIGLQNLSDLLFYSAGIMQKNDDSNKTKRVYPSGGARYPLEIYSLVLKETEEIREGIYHYNVKEHCLEKLLEQKNLIEDLYPKAIWQDMIKKSSLILVISAVVERNMMKYKNRGYRYILFEAGHLGQNIYLVSNALGLKCCAMGGFDDDKLNEILDIDGEKEIALYVFALGE